MLAKFLLCRTQNYLGNCVKKCNCLQIPALKIETGPCLCFLPILSQFCESQYHTFPQHSCVSLWTHVWVGRFQVAYANINQILPSFSVLGFVTTYHQCGVYQGTGYVLYWNANSWLGEQKRKWGNDSLEEWWVLCTASWLHWNPIFRGEWLLNPRWCGLVSAPQCGKTSGEKCTDSPKSDSACTGICHISPALRRGLGWDKETNKTQEETCFCLHIAVYRIVYVN